MQLHWDVFCSVIDNYGDIGIGWRVAHALAVRHDQSVRLWVDDLESFARLCPELDVRAESQYLGRVEVRHWHPQATLVDPQDVVVELFACRVTEAYLQRMAVVRPVWINLEYFSAEPWVAECHALGSPHPRLPLTQYFFLPGLEAGTGGVLGDVYELDELDSRRNSKPDFVSPLNASIPARRISLFSYENPAIAGLVRALSQDAQPSELLVPQGKPTEWVERALGKPLETGVWQSQGALHVLSLPFLSQAEYDRLLWWSDINIVRGEDSFIRAQQAARPLVWQAYVQEDGAQWPKMDAFLAQYQVGLGQQAIDAMQTLWRSWNAPEANADSWVAWLHHVPEYTAHARTWVAGLRQKPDLVSNLVHFVLEKHAARRL